MKQSLHNRWRSALLAAMIMSVSEPAVLARDFTYTSPDGRTLTYTVISEQDKTCMTKAGYYNSEDDWESGNRASGTVIIPAKVSDGTDIFTVTELGDYSFFRWAYVGAVLPPTITKVGNKALVSGASFLKVAYPESLTSLDVSETDLAIKYPSDALVTDEGLIFDKKKQIMYYAPSTLKGEYEIPGTVYRINDNAFYLCGELTAVKLPESVTQIGQKAFYMCDGLTSLTLPSMINSLEERAFAACTNLTKIVSMKPVPVNLRKDVFSADVYQSAILDVPEDYISEYLANGWGNFVNIHEGGFPTREFEDDNYKYRLIENPDAPAAVLLGPAVSPFTATSVTLPVYLTAGEPGANPVNYYLTGIGYNAFRRYTQLATVNLDKDKSKIRIIHSYAFEGCENLTSMTFNDVIKTIGAGAFSQCRNLQKVILPNSLTEIGGAAFSNCEKLSEVVFGSALQTIGRSAFNKCSSLSNVTLPPGVVDIGSSAFAKCGISHIIIGPNVTKIGTSALSDNLTNSVTITAQVPPVIYNNTFGSAEELIVQDNPGQTVVADRYKAANHWSNFKIVHGMVLAEKIVADVQRLTYKADSSVQISANVEPANATLQDIFWRSTNPDVATVDNFGCVTFHPIVTGDGDTAPECKIIAETLYANGPVLELNVEGIDAGVEDILIDSPAQGVDRNASYEVYNLNGSKLGGSIDNLAAGVYILRQGSVVEKVLVK